MLFASFFFAPAICHPVPEVRKYESCLNNSSIVHRRMSFSPVDFEQDVSRGKKELKCTGTLLLGKERERNGKGSEGTWRHQRLETQKWKYARRTEKSRLRANEIREMSRCPLNACEIFPAISRGDELVNVAIQRALINSWPLSLFSWVTSYKYFYASNMNKTEINWKSNFSVSV